MNSKIQQFLYKLNKIGHFKVKSNTVEGILSRILSLYYG